MIGRSFAGWKCNRFELRLPNSGDGATSTRQTAVSFAEVHKTGLGFFADVGGRLCWAQKTHYTHGPPALGEALALWILV